jgi:hypothetical protein
LRVSWVQPARYTARVQIASQQHTHLRASANMSANASLDSPTDEKYGADFKSEYAHQEATAPKSALEAIGVRVVNRPEELASAESKQVGSAALAAALSKSAINPTSKESFTLYACCFITL